MGLDMYFYATKQEYTSECSWRKEEQPTVINYPEDLSALEKYVVKTDYKSCTVKTSYRIGYFRKFNALHSYIINNFADGVDDCREIELSKEDIQQILKVLYKAKDGNTACLPTQAGFFFGSTEYDDWYFSDVDKAIELFNLILNTVDFKEYYITYGASW